MKKKKNQNTNSLILEHILPIGQSRYIFIFGFNSKNEIIYSYSDKPQVYLSNVIELDGTWVNLGELRLPAVYFKKYLKIKK